MFLRSHEVQNISLSTRMRRGGCPGDIQLGSDEFTSTMGCFLLED